MTNWRTSRRLALAVLTVAAVAVATSSVRADGTMPPITERFKDAAVTETPSFQKHVVPLFGRLGCNGRSCHGSFQGRGGFRLSLFGYDFKADHDALLDKESPRVTTEKPLESLIIAKPTDSEMHEGGVRYEKGSWQYHVIRRWIEGGAKFEGEIVKLNDLQVLPSEIAFSKAGETVQLKAVAVWADGTQEDVTPLCRFQSNDDQVCTIDDQGLVTATKPGDTHVVASYDKAVVTVPVLQPVSNLIADKYPSVPTPTRVDELVVAKLKKLGIVPSDVCTDAEFLRRVSLDLSGTLPTEDEVRAFLADASPDKRSRKVDELLETPAYAAWWTTKLCDFTGNNDAQLNNVGVVRGRVTQDWWDWINKRVAENVPYDQLAAGIVLGKSREEGESYSEYCQVMSEISQRKEGRSYAERKYMPYYWAKNNTRQPEERAIAFAYSFMGTRIECAQCHKHPFDQWSKDDFDQFKRFFTAIVANNNNVSPEARDEFTKMTKELGLAERRLNNNERQKILVEALNEGKVVPHPEIYVNQPRAAAPQRNKGNNRRQDTNSAPTARILGGETVDLTKVADSREPLMNWLRGESNPFFARAFVNRVWANYFHAGIVNPTDDMNLANPPSNTPLLDYLTEEFIRSGFDMKSLHRMIVNSRTYQLSWVTNDTNKLDERNFSHAVPRRLPAEIAVDALHQAIVSDARASTMRTDLKNRAIAIAASSARNNRGGPQFALTVFGRSTRESNCDCDRSMDASLLQTVYLQNDFDIRTLLENRDSWVNEVTQKLAKAGSQETGAKVKPAGPDATAIAAQIKTMERKIERLKQQPKAVKQVEQLTKQLAGLNEQLAAEKRKSSGKGKSEALKLDDPTVVRPVIESAYLRTLSRYPTADEVAIATQYIVEDGDLAGGLRDVLWALVNTKEFIVNH